MKLHRETFEVQSEGLHPTFHDVTDQVRSAVANSGVRDGICIVYSHHTTCSVMMQEASHDTTALGLEHLQQDLCNIMERLIPTCRAEGEYLHPGPKHIVEGEKAGDPGPWASLNTDAHLRSVIFGRSESMVVAGGELDCGQFGHVYFVDWDQVRARKRIGQVQIIGE
jgi:secondary thiamine-phosphate synthase enzyme